MINITDENVKLPDMEFVSTNLLHNGVEITPSGSVVPVYLVPQTKEEIALLAEEQAKQEAFQKEREKQKQSALKKLQKLGLTEEEVNALLGL